MHSYKESSSFSSTAPPKNNMGHTEEKVFVSNPKILVTKNSGFFSVKFENSPISAVFSAETQSQAIENLVAWFENRSIKLQEELETITETIRKNKSCIDEVKKAIEDNRIEVS